MLIGTRWEFITIVVSLMQKRTVVFSRGRAPIVPDRLYCQNGPLSQFAPRRTICRRSEPKGETFVPGQAFNWLPPQITCKGTNDVT